MFAFYNIFWVCFVCLFVGFFICVCLFLCCSRFFFKTRRNKLRLVFMVQLTLLQFNVVWVFLHLLHPKIWIWFFHFFNTADNLCFQSEQDNPWLLDWAQKVLFSAGVSSGFLQWLGLTRAALTGWGWQQSQLLPSKHPFVAKCPPAFSEISGVSFNKRGNRRSSPLIRRTIKLVISDLLPLLAFRPRVRTPQISVLCHSLWAALVFYLLRGLAFAHHQPNVYAL